MSHATILVVDDNEDNREILRARLAAKGFTAVTANDGPAALERLAAGGIDLVVLDIMMPGMSGMDVLREVRRTRNSVELPVIMATAKTDSQGVVEALELGANDYVTKPIEYAVLVARIHSQLRTRVAAVPPPAEPHAPGAIGPGTLLAGRYRIDERIGAGSFGTVFRALHVDLQKPVAVKVLQTGVRGEEEALARFRREGATACRVAHPNAVAVHDLGVTPAGIAYLVMELLEGRSLQEELAAVGRLNVARAAQVLVPVCQALAVAHARGIVHRDIKPSNIFLQRTRTGETVKVVDFGIAKMSDDAAAGEPLTLEGQLVGTLAYMAPERFGGAICDSAADVYSMGATLFEVLCGRPPFVAPAGNALALVVQHGSEPPPSPRQWAPEVPPRLEQLVFASLAKHPADRPTVEAFGAALSAALQDPAAVSLTPPATPPPPVVRVHHDTLAGLEAPPAGPGGAGEPSDA